nr:tRNA-dihydrouridine synthase family protein [uncultured Treponema sp.]
MKLILAPLANISHAGLRMLIHTFDDPDEYFTEMIHAPSLLSGGPFEQWYLRTNPVPEKLVWQLTSPHEDALVQAVPVVLQYGGIGIDLNMGCSAPPIVRSGAGFAWMQKPLHTTAAAVRAVRQAVDEYAAVQGRNFRLSVKLRLGTSADYPFLLRFCRMLIDEGVELITIHPRLQRQSYGRPALHEYTAALARDVDVPVYGNGDVDTPKKLAAVMRKAPCAGWMIGRAAVRMPWIFKAIRRGSGVEPYRIDLEQTALLFLQLLQTEQPPSFYRTRAQRFFQFYCDNFSFAHYCKTQLLRAGSLDEAAHILHTYFEQAPDDKVIEI